MEILIDIPEHQYNNIMTISSVNLGRSLYKGVIMSVVRAIQKGTVLPKGHGDLKDYNNLWDIYHDNDYDFYEALDAAPIIIPADSEGEV